MDSIAGFLRRKIRNVKINPRLRLARVFVVAYQKRARPEDVERLLIENVVGSLPPVNLLGEGTQRGARRENLAARMGLED